MQTILNSPSIQLLYNEDKKLLIQSWKGSVDSNMFREAIDKTVELVATKKIDRIISNTQRQNVVTPKDTKYASKVMPKLFRNGLKKMAFVLPKSAKTKMSLTIFSTNIPQHPGVRYFDSLEDAEFWLD